MLRRTALLFVSLLVAGLAFSQDQKSGTPPAQPASIGRSALEKRLDGLKQAHLQAVANVQALDGAIQDVEYWLAELDKAEKEAEQKAKKVEPAKDKVDSTKPTKEAKNGT